MNHKIEPRREGRGAYCAVCGYAVVRYRAGLRTVRGKRVAVPAHWKHMTAGQAAIGWLASQRAGLR